MAIEVGEDDERGTGEWLYDVLRSRVGGLTQGAQLALGLALSRGTPWSALTAEQRQALAEAAEDLEL